MASSRQLEASRYVELQGSNWTSRRPEKCSTVNMGEVGSSHTLVLEAELGIEVVPDTQGVEDHTQEAAHSLREVGDAAADKPAHILRVVDIQLAVDIPELGGQVVETLEVDTLEMDILEGHTQGTQAVPRHRALKNVDQVTSGDAADCVTFDGSRHCSFCCAP